MSSSPILPKIPHDRRRRHSHPSPTPPHHWDHPPPTRDAACRLFRATPRRLLLAGLRRPGTPVKKRRASAVVGVGGAGVGGGGVGRMRRATLSAGSRLRAAAKAVAAAARFKAGVSKVVSNRAVVGPITAPERTRRFSGTDVSLAKSKLGYFDALESYMFPVMEVDGVEEKIPKEQVQKRPDYSKFYSRKALVTREAIRFSRTFQNAMLRLWKAFCATEGHTFMDETAYKLFFRQVQTELGSHVGETGGTEEAEDDALLRDWERDSRGDGVLDYQEFTVGVFQLADFWTPVISEHAYAAFVNALTDKLTRVNSRGVLVLRFRVGTGPLDHESLHDDDEEEEDEEEEEEMDGFGWGKVRGGEESEEESVEEELEGMRVEKSLMGEEVGKLDLPSARGDGGGGETARSVMRGKGMMKPPLYLRNVPLPPKKIRAPTKPVSPFSEPFERGSLYDPPSPFTPSLPNRYLDVPSSPVLRRVRTSSNASDSLDRVMSEGDFWNTNVPSPKLRRRASSRFNLKSDFALSIEERSLATATTFSSSRPSSTSPFLTSSHASRASSVISEANSEANSKAPSEASKKEHCEATSKAPSEASATAPSKTPSDTRITATSSPPLSPLPSPLPPLPAPPPSSPTLLSSPLTSTPLRRFRGSMSPHTLRPRTSPLPPSPLRARTPVLLDSLRPRTRGVDWVGEVGVGEGGVGEVVVGDEVLEEKEHLLHVASKVVEVERRVGTAPLPLRERDGDRRLAEIAMGGWRGVRGFIPTGHNVSTPHVSLPPVPKSTDTSAKEWELLRLGALRPASAVGGRRGRRSGVEVLRRGAARFVRRRGEAIAAVPRRIAGQPVAFYDAVAQQFVVRKSKATPSSAVQRILSQKDGVEWECVHAEQDAERKVAEEKKRDTERHAQRRRRKKSPNTAAKRWGEGRRRLAAAARWFPRCIES